LNSPVYQTVPSGLPSFEQELPALVRFVCKQDPHPIKMVCRSDYVKEFLTKQEYTSAHTYKLNLNAQKMLKYYKFSFKFDTLEFAAEIK
jgi:hypothetical protein